MFKRLTAFVLPVVLLAALATSALASPAASPARKSGGTVLHLASPKTGGLMFNTKHLSARAGKVTISFTNPSFTPHNVTLQVGTHGKTVGKTPTFTHGTKSFTVTLKKGTYTYYCSVPGHRSAGMFGTLTVS